MIIHTILVFQIFKHCITCVSLICLNGDTKFCDLGFNPTCAKLAFTKKVTHKYCIYKFKTKVKLKLEETHKNVSRP